MSDENLMQYCLGLANRGLGSVSPNPMVGAVITVDNQIIGEGYHQKFGQAHAEVNAINDVYARFGKQADALLRQATVYCNLEPCAHFGKTPPCADLLVNKGVKRVVIGNTDPFASVNGKGIEKLKNAGIEVKTGILEHECRHLNRRFFTRITQNRPYIILKWAQTANSYFAPNNGSQKWITGPAAKSLNFKWRSEEDAILVGKNTALIDNPQLTNRGNGKQPIRILIDKKLTVTPEYNIYNNKSKTIIFNEIKTDIYNNIQYISMEDMHFYLPQKIAYQLYLMDIQSVIVEGGANILNQFLSAGLWDEIRVFTSTNNWPEGMIAPKFEGTIIQQQQVGDDFLTIYEPTKP